MSIKLSGEPLKAFFNSILAVFPESGPPPKAFLGLAYNLLIEDPAIASIKEFITRDQFKNLVSAIGNKLLTQHGFASFRNLDKARLTEFLETVLFPQIDQGLISREIQKAIDTKSAIDAPIERSKFVYQSSVIYPSVHVNRELSRHNVDALEYITYPNMWPTCYLTNEPPSELFHFNLWIQLSNMIRPELIPITGPRTMKISQLLSFLRIEPEFEGLWPVVGNEPVAETEFSIWHYDSIDITTREPYQGATPICNTTHVKTAMAAHSREKPLYLICNKTKKF